MDALAIIALTFRQVFQTPGQTLRIFFLPFLLAIAGQLLFMLQVLPGAGPEVIKAGIIALIILKIALTAWAAVNFHRHTIVGERFSAVPRLYLRETLAYAMVAIPIALAVYGVTLVLSLIQARFVMELLSVGGAIQATGILIRLIFLVLLLNLSAPLPSLAIGKNFGAEFSRTRRATLSICLIALLMVAASSGISQLWLVASGHIAPLMMHMLAAGWLPVMIAAVLLFEAVQAVFGVSLLTAIYRSYSKITPPPS